MGQQGDRDKKVFVPKTTPSGKKVPQHQRLMMTRMQEKSVTPDSTKDHIDRIEEADEKAALAKLEINQSLFEINFDELDIHRSIGSGGSDAIVFRATWHENDVAFKAFKIQAFLDERCYEVKILASMSHPNLVRWFGATIKPPRVGIVMEFCPNGDLKSYLMRHPTFPLSGRLRFLREVASGMNYLHTPPRNIMHRDLKPENVLLDSSLRAKLIDFGLSRTADAANVAKTVRVGTSHYMAPEVVVGSGLYDLRIDIFSFSIMAYEILTGDFDPFGVQEGQTSSFGIELRIASDATNRPRFGKVAEGDLLSNIGGIIPPRVIEMVENGWSHEVDSRPSFGEILVVLKGVKEEELLGGSGGSGDESKTDEQTHQQTTGGEEEDRNLKEGYLEEVVGDGGGGGSVEDDKTEEVEVEVLLGEGRVEEEEKDPVTEPKRIIDDDEAVAMIATTATTTTITPVEEESEGEGEEEKEGEEESRHYGIFSWKDSARVSLQPPGGTLVHLSLTHTSPLPLTWLNDLAFYHQETGSRHYWYYIWDTSKNLYHCVKYFARYGFYELGNWGPGTVVVKENAVVGDFNWKGSKLSVTEDPQELVFGEAKHQIVTLNERAFYHKAATGPDYWYYVWSGSEYHCFRFKGGAGFFEMEEEQEENETDVVVVGGAAATGADEPIRRHLGQFLWKGSSALEIRDDVLVWNSAPRTLTWVNDFAFYHKESNHYWYYIWDESKNLYHCIKYFGRYGFYEMGNWGPETVRVVEGKTLGEFNWKGTKLRICEGQEVWFGSDRYSITWINRTTFHHQVKDSPDYWYYIWSGKLYHCVRYKGSSGFAETKPAEG